MKFSASKFELELISQIADRALKVGAKQGEKLIKHEVMMDLDACHSNGTPLDLNKLLAAPPFDFSHDIGGINRHINRETGKIEDCFLPRCYMRSSHAISKEV